MIDTAGVTVQLSEKFGVRAHDAAQLWREKQLEYTFRRGLMRRYVNFDACTAQALDYVSAQLGIRLDEAEQGELLKSYLRLPAFPDVRPGLESLRNSGHRLVALTNGTEHSVASLLENAGVAGYFEAILSADRIGTFKPDPAVYSLLTQVMDAPHTQALLVSGNPFDVIGAKACGLKVAWLCRDPRRIFDPWEYPPDVVVRTLDELCGVLPRLQLGGGQT